MTTRPLDPDSVRDACAFLRATLTNDAEARAAIAKACDPSGMVDAICFMHLRLLVQVHPDPAAHLESVRAHAEEFAATISYVSDMPRRTGGAS